MFGQESACITIRLEATILKQRVIDSVVFDFFFGWWAWLTLLKYWYRTLRWVAENSNEHVKNFESGVK